MIIANEVTLASLLEFIHANEVLAYDTETTGLNVRKDRVIGFGVSNAYNAFYVPLLSYHTDSATLRPTGLGPTQIKLILKALSTRKLLMFNASFDARITKYDLGVDLLPALHADVLLLKHTCDEEFPFGLKEIAKKLWGHDVTKEKADMLASIKANGGTAKEYYKADTDILGLYCEQDCKLTFRLYNHYLPKLYAQKLNKFYFDEEVLPLYKEVTIPMEEVGVELDIPKLHKAREDINRVLSDVEAGIQTAIVPHLGPFTTWFLNKDYADQTPTGKAPTWSKRFKTKLEAWQSNGEHYMFNLQSKHHLKKLFFDTLKETPSSFTKPSKTFPKGQPQVDENFLDLMAKKYNWCEKLVEFNKLNKLKSTYIDRLLEGNEDGRYYPSFKQHGTVSGRYGGDMQQLPRTLESGPANIVYFTNLIREFVIPCPGAVLVSADYEQLEPSIFSHTSGDPALQRIFNENTDFYSEVAIKTEGLADVSAAKDSENYLGRIDKMARQKAKSYALGIAYGMTGYKLAFEIIPEHAELIAYIQKNIELDDEDVDDASDQVKVNKKLADKLVTDYLKAFPKLKEWMDVSKQYVRVNGRISTQTGRVRHMPRAKELFAAYGREIDSDLKLHQAYSEMPDVYKKARMDRKEYKKLLNNAINFQVQGLAASIVNRAAIAINRKLKTEKLSSKLILQVHDELVFEVPQAETDIVCTLVKDIMENVIKLTVPLRTTPQLGTNYRQCK